MTIIVLLLSIQFYLALYDIRNWFIAGMSFGMKCHLGYSTRLCCQSYTLYYVIMCLFGGSVTQFLFFIFIWYNCLLCDQMIWYKQFNLRIVDMSNFSCICLKSYDSLPFIRISKKNRKEKVQKDKQLSTKHIYKTKDRVIRTPQKTGSELRCSGRVGSFYSTCDTTLCSTCVSSFQY
jgi:hypothetical protein